MQKVPHKKLETIEKSQIRKIWLKILENPFFLNESLSFERHGNQNHVKHFKLFKSMNSIAKSRELQRMYSNAHLINLNLS